ncbi:hypothetical protein OAL25_00745 [bacterium]|nr:hypothetical protein [bacterium]
MIVIEFETKCAKYRKRAIKDAILFASNQLMSRIRKPVYINIRAIRKLAEKQGVYGDCMDEGDREFTIRIDVSLPFDEMITTILHEMVHVWQYVSKRMVQNWSDEIRFTKQVYSSELPYDTRPWEIEAHRLEKQLKEKWDGHCRY